MNTSEIFWNQITSVDHAILLPNGHIVGNSFDLGAVVTGGLDSDEQVVVDFSAGKKLIKAFIDGPLGLDHKVWVHQDQVTILGGSNDVLINSELFSIILPRDSVYIYSDVHCEPSAFINELVKQTLNQIRPAVEEYLCARAHPGIQVSSLYVSANQPDMRQFYDYSKAQFRYAHGLPRSTSFGCQNPLHGHLSYVALRLNGCGSYQADQMSERAILCNLFTELGVSGAMVAATNEYDDYVRVPSFYFYNQHTQRGDYIQFKTLDRGHRTMVLNQTPNAEVLDPLSCTRFVELPDYSTIENLVVLFGQRVELLLRAQGFKGSFDLVVSEGLNKGSRYSATI